MRENEGDKGVGGVYSEHRENIKRKGNEQFLQTVFVIFALSLLTCCVAHVLPMQHGLRADQCVYVQIFSSIHEFYVAKYQSVIIQAHLPVLLEKSKGGRRRDVVGRRLQTMEQTEKRRIRG